MSFRDRFSLSKGRERQGDFAQMRFEAKAWKKAFDALHAEWLSPENVRVLMGYVVLIENTERAGEDWSPIYVDALENAKFTPQMKVLLKEAATGIAAKGLMV